MCVLKITETEHESAKMALLWCEDGGFPAESLCRKAADLSLSSHETFSTSHVCCPGLLGPGCSLLASSPFLRPRCVSFSTLPNLATRKKEKQTTLISKSKTRVEGTEWPSVGQASPPSPQAAVLRGPGFLLRVLR